MVSMAVTLKTLARMAGLSESTISRCLNDSPLVAEETKERVLRLAQEQGFHFNANARGLSSKKNYTIGVIYPDNRYDFHTRDVYKRQVDIVQCLLNVHGQRLLRPFC